jgi:hypothetical protein
MFKRNREAMHKTTKSILLASNLGLLEEKINKVKKDTGNK